MENKKITPVVPLQNIQVRKDSFECSITTDIVVFGYIDQKLKVLLTKRSVGSYQNRWMLPGGVMEEGETLADCAQKVLYILTGLKDIHFKQVKTYGGLDRHPLKRVITVCFYAMIKPENHHLAQGDKVTELSWHDLDVIPPNMGFDHAQLIQESYAYIKDNLNDRLLIQELLPQEFTLLELQGLYEGVLDTSLDKRNFRKWILQKDILTNTGQKKIGVKGGPILYRCKT